MITYVNKSNTAAYSFLFSEVSELLRTRDANGNKVPLGDEKAVMKMQAVTPALTADEYVPNRYYIKKDNEYVICADDKENFVEQDYFLCDTITSLDEFFSYIREIAEIEPRYTRLPLDEEVFTIDANARTITVPPSFQKNGISVQGDEISEIVYFKVNRFYDATDLYGNPDEEDPGKKMEIFIQWKAPSGATGVSRPWIVDVESEPGYIIFGWPLSSKITEKSGTVEFSVRFYKYDPEDKIVTYSLATLTQTASIKPSLDFDLLGIFEDGAQIDDATGLISDRFVNSPLLDGTNKADNPEFLSGYELPLTMNLEKDGDEFRTVSVPFNVQATVTDAGQISYYWRKYNIDTKQKEKITYTITEIGTKDAKPVQGKLYFFKNGGSLSPINVADYATGFEVGEDEAGNVIYTTKDGEHRILEKVSQAIIDSCGYYYVIATNRVRNVTAETRSPKNVDEAGETIASYCVVPRPVAPTVAEGMDVPERAILTLDNKFSITLDDNATNSDAGKLTYQWFYSKTGEEGTFEPIVDKEIMIDDETDEEIEVEIPAVAKSYTIKGAFVTETQLDEAGNEMEIPVGPVESAEGASGDGYYKVVTTNNLNKLSAEAIEALKNAAPAGTEIEPKAQAFLESKVCRVTHPATKMDIAIVGGKVNYSTQEILDGTPLEIKATIPVDSGENAMWSAEQGDHVTYQWYHYYADNSNLTADLAASNAGTYKVNGDTELDGATDVKYYPNESGYYFCEVTNHYNGTTAVKCSRFFSVQIV